MNSARLSRALLAAAVGAGVWVGLVRAQEPIVAPSPSREAMAAPALVPGGPMFVQPPLQYISPEASSAAPSPLSNPLIVQVHPQFQSPPFIPPDAIAAPEPTVDDYPGKHGCVANWLHRHNFCCYANVNSVGCGSLKSECTFIFGSCRAFYSEPCLPGKPAPPYYPAYYGFSPPPGFNGYKKAGCGCP